VNRWSALVVKSENAQKKCYAIDQGLGAALDYKLSQDKGRLLETTAALELQKQGKQIAYHQNGSQFDFVVTDRGNVTAATQVIIDILIARPGNERSKDMVKVANFWSS
jgi:predicted AAA+ superfamily ATPase